MMFKICKASVTDVVCVPHLIECAVGKSACLAGSGVAPFELDVE